MVDSSLELSHGKPRDQAGVAVRIDPLGASVVEDLTRAELALSQGARAVNTAPGWKEHIKAPRVSFLVDTYSRPGNPRSNRDSLLGSAPLKWTGT